MSCDTIVFEQFPLGAALDASFDSALDTSFESAMDNSFDSALDTSFDATLDESFDAAMDESSNSSFSEEPIPLENAWCLWFDRYIGPGFSADEYAASMLEVAIFDDVQSYWRWTNNLPEAGKLEATCSYHLMKKGIRPLWEDKSNVNGGSFSFRISSADTFDEIWTTISLNAIAGQFDLFLSNFFNELCGVSIGMRRNEASFTIWTSNAKSFDVQKMADFIACLLKDTRIIWTSDLFSFKVHHTLDNFGNQSKAAIKTPTRPTGNMKSRSPRNFNQSNPRASKKDMRMKIPKYAAVGR